MRKFLLIIAALMLSACAGNESATNTEKSAEVNGANEETGQPDYDDEVKNFIEENNVQLDDEGYFVETNDPIEAGNKNNGIIVFNDDFEETYLVKEWYTNNDTDDDGYNVVGFDGYEVKYAVALIENTEEQDMIGFFVETENNTDKTIQYNMDAEIMTNEQEQTETDNMYGIGESKPGINTKGFVLAELAYDTPSELTITFEPPWDAEDEFNEEVGEPVEVKFNK